MIFWLKSLTIRSLHHSRKSALRSSKVSKSTFDRIKRYLLEQKSRKPSEIIFKRRFLVKNYGTFKENFERRFKRNKVKVFSYTSIISRNVFKLVKNFFRRNWSTAFTNALKEIYHEKSSFRQDRRSFALGSEQDEFRILSKYFIAFIMHLQAHKLNDYWITSVRRLLTFTDQLTEVMPLTRIQYLTCPSHLCES